MKIQSFHCIPQFFQNTLNKERMTNISSVCDGMRWNGIFRLITIINR